MENYMPIRKKLTESECRKKLADAVESEVELKLDNFRDQVCGPRILLTDKINTDITELKTFHATHEKLLETIRISQDLVLHRLDTVSANGNLGLEASIKDLYTRVDETHSMLHNWVKIEETKFTNKTIRQLFTEKSTIGKVLWYGVLFVVTTIVLHSFGIDIAQVIDMFKTVGGK